jgi:hypothetical protein
MYFCVVLCIVCFVTFPVLFMCTEQLPPGGYPTAVKYISYHTVAGTVWLGYGLGGPGLESQGRDSLFSETSRPALWTAQPRVQLVSEFIPGNKAAKGYCSPLTAI